MTTYYPDPESKSRRKKDRRNLVRYLIDHDHFTIWDIRRIFEYMKLIDSFRYKGVLLDFRGWK